MHRSHRIDDVSFSPHSGEDQSFFPSPRTVGETNRFFLLPAQWERPIVFSFSPHSGGDQSFFPSPPHSGGRRWRAASDEGQDICNTSRNASRNAPLMDCCHSLSVRFYRKLETAFGLLCGIVFLQKNLSHSNRSRPLYTFIRASRANAIRVMPAASA